MGSEIHVRHAWTHVRASISPLAIANTINLPEVQSKLEGTMTADMYGYVRYSCTRCHLACFPFPFCLHQENILETTISPSQNHSDPVTPLSNINLDPTRI